MERAARISCFNFITESAVVNFLALLVAVTLMQFARIPFNTLFNISINNLWEIDMGALAFFAVVVLFSICVTGLYPVLVARKNSASLFRRTDGTDQKSLFSSGLVIIQYTSAIDLSNRLQLLYFENIEMFQNESIKGKIVKKISFLMSEKCLSYMVHRLASDS